VNENGWNGAIFAAAGLKRIGLDDNISAYLDWMVPAPAQGAMAVMVREDDERMIEITSQLNHKDTALCTGIERELLNEMEAGCSAPVGAFAEIIDGSVQLSAIALKTDGSLQYDIEMSAPMDDAKGLGREAGRKLLEMGASEIVADLRS